jgi:MFS family permease
MSEIFPGILLTKLVMAIGLSGPASTPLVADYVKNRSRGMASAYIGLFAGIGVICGMFVLFGLTNDMSYRKSYGIAAGLTIAIAFFLLYAIKDVEYQRKHVTNLPLMTKVSIITA